MNIKPDPSMMFTEEPLVERVLPCRVHRHARTGKAWQFSCCAFLLVLLLGGSQEAQAQFENKALAVGSLAQTYNEVGGQTEYWKNGYGLEWPAWYRNEGVMRAEAMWVGVQGFVDEAGNVGPFIDDQGNEFPLRVVHVGPRATGAGEYFPVRFETISRFEPPEVYVDGFPTFQYIPDVDVVTDTLQPARMIVNTVNSLTGITVTRRLMQWSNQFHDNYHIQEYILTNTGQLDDDEEVELPDKTIAGVVLHFQKRYVINNRHFVPGQEWGANVMNDIVGDVVEDVEPEFRAQYAWMGNSPGADIDPLGAPIWSDNYWFTQPGDSVGRLSAPQFVGTATLFAPPAGEVSPENMVDSPLQPFTTGFICADDNLLSNNDPFDIPMMTREFEMITQGHMLPHHADLIDEDGDFATPEGAPKMDCPGGQTNLYTYGPYTLEPGESVKIVIVEAVDGLNRQEAVEVGRQFKQLAEGREELATTALATTPNITLRDVTLGKNQWVLTGRDSLFQTFRKARANFENGFNIPHAPMPPKVFRVESGVDEIVLSWDYYGDADHETVEIFRGRNLFEGAVEDDFEYEMIAQLDGSETSYRDTEVQRGIPYFYFIQTIGRSNPDPTGLTPTNVPLRSNRIYTQTYDPALLKRPPGETTSDFQIVPNPYNIGASRDVRWPDQDRLAFLDVPGEAVIRIYTELGELVRVIEHDDGSGDAYWDLMTEDRQLVVSGIYIAVVENLNPESGEAAQSIKKFAIIR